MRSNLSRVSYSRRVPELVEDFSSVESLTPEAAWHVHRFLESTSALTASEQAELLGTMVEAANSAAASSSARRTPATPPSRTSTPSTASTSRTPASPNSRASRSPGSSGSSGSQGFDWSSLGRGIQQGLGLFQTGAQLAGGLATAFGGNDAGARDFSMWANRLGQGAGQVNSMVGGFTGQAPSQGFAPAPSFGPAPSFAPAPSLAGAPMFEPSLMAGGMPAGLPPQFTAQAAPQANATALMALLMNNPQIVQAMQAAPFSPTPQGVAINLPNQAPMSIPLNAVMNTIAQLAQASTRELSAMPGESDQDVPNYLLAGDGSFIVDPDDPQQRAALALHWLRAGAEAQRLGSPQAFAGGGTSFDEAEAWAREAGFDD